MKIVRTPLDRERREAKEQRDRIVTLSTRLNALVDEHAPATSIIEAAEQLRAAALSNAGTQRELLLRQPYSEAQQRYIAEIQRGLQAWRSFSVDEIIVQSGRILLRG
jgi:hypothetical protein